MPQTKVEAIVADGDDTLWKGRVAEGIGKAYLLGELRTFHLGTFVAGLKCARRVSETTRNKGVNREIEGLKSFYNSLVENGLGTEQTMYRYAGRYIQRHRLTAVSVFLGQFDCPKFLATVGGSTAATAAAEIFGFKEFISNRDLFEQDSHKLRGIKIDVRNGEDKYRQTVKMLERHNLRLEKCDVVGNDMLDVPILQAAHQPYASPLATEEVKRIKGIIQL